MHARNGRNETVITHSKQAPYSNVLAYFFLLKTNINFKNYY